jgi:Fe-S cluster biosynthesis and repair protein YggX
MARLVNCIKHKKEMEGLDFPPFPGPKGQYIYENVCKQAWQEWMAHQTTLINEKRLNMMDMTDRAYLDEQRDKFFAGDEVDQAEGYIPPEES